MLNKTQLQKIAEEIQDKLIQEGKLLKRIAVVVKKRSRGIAKYNKLTGEALVLLPLWLGAESSVQNLINKAKSKALEIGATIDLDFISYVRGYILHEYAHVIRRRSGSIAKHDKQFYVMFESLGGNILQDVAYKPRIVTSVYNEKIRKQDSRFARELQQTEKESRKAEIRHEIKPGNTILYQGTECAVTGKSGNGKYRILYNGKVKFVYPEGARSNG